MRTFVERWFDRDVTYDVMLDVELRRFEVCVGDEVVFTSLEFVEILRFCLTGESLELTTAEPIDLSPPWEPEPESSG